MSKFSKVTDLTNSRSLLRHLWWKTNMVLRCISKFAAENLTSVKLPTEVFIWCLLCGTSQSLACQGNLSECEWQPGSSSLCHADHTGLQFGSGSQASSQQEMAQCSAGTTSRVVLKLGLLWVGLNWPARLTWKWPGSMHFLRFSVCVALTTALSCPIFPQTHRLWEYIYFFNYIFFFKAIGKIACPQERKTRNQRDNKGTKLSLESLFKFPVIHELWFLIFLNLALG